MQLTGLCGEVLWVDADMIAAVQAVPCTVVSLTDGRCVEVAEEVAQVVEKVTRCRARLLVAAVELAELAEDAPLADIRPLRPQRGRAPGGGQGRTTNLGRR